MAFIQNNQNDEEEDKAAQPGQSSGDSSGIISAGQAPSAKGSPNKPQSFATLQSYLKPNAPQGEALAGQIAQKTSAVGDEARTSVTNAANTVGAKVSQNTYKPEVIDNALSNPTEFVKNPANVSEFTKQRTAQYQGPNSFEENPEAIEAQNKVRQAVDKSKLLDSESGQKQLLSDVQENKAQGVTALNQALLSTNPNASATLQGAKASFSGLEDMLTNKGGEINTNIQASKQAADKARTEATAKIDAKINEFAAGLQQKTTDARATMDALAQSATAKLQNGQDLTSDELKALNTSKEIMAEIRKQQDILRRYYGTDFQVGSYATAQKGDTAIQPGNLATGADYDYEKALEVLGGNELPYLQESGRGQAGTAPSSLIDFKGDQARTDVNKLALEKDNQVLGSLTFDQKNVIDNSSQFYDPRSMWSVRAALQDPTRWARFTTGLSARQAMLAVMAAARQGKTGGVSGITNSYIPGLTEEEMAQLDAQIKAQ